MKIFILFLLVFISHVDLRRRNDDDDDDIYELSDLLKNQYRHKHRPNKQYIDDDEYIPPSYKYEKEYPSRKKVLKEDYDDSDDGELYPTPSPKSGNRAESKTTTTTTKQNDILPPSSCINQYDIKSEQLVKVKQLKNGAHLIRYVLIDTPSDRNTKDICMEDCCAEKTCDLAMLSEQHTHEGYKCYLFACNNSCTIASHQDYTVMVPKKDSAYYTKSVETKPDGIVSSTLVNDKLSYKKSIFRETAVIIFLVFGLLCTILLFVFIYSYCRSSRKRGRRPKNYSVDADYLINGLYL